MDWLNAIDFQLVELTIAAAAFCAANPGCGRPRPTLD
jgi:hypothetical protein